MVALLDTHPRPTLTEHPGLKVAPGGSPGFTHGSPRPFRTSTRLRCDKDVHNDPESDGS
jgi:hypothetical protein